MSAGDKVDEKRHQQNVESYITEQKTAAEDAHHNLLSDAFDWMGENPGTSTAIGLVALAGVGYLTRGKWMPALSRLAPEAADAGIAAAGKKGGFNAAKAGLTSLSELASPELQGWKMAMGGYADVGVDTAGTMFYRGVRAGAFDATNTLVVEGAAEAKTLYNAISREGFLQRNVWARGAAGTASEFGEVTLPGKTRFLFGEAVPVELPSGGKLINLNNGEFHALSAENAAKLYAGL